MLLSEPTAKVGPTYEALLTRLLESPGEINKRTGHEIKALRGGATFKLSLSDHTIPVVGRRKLFPATAAAEVAWFVSGTQDVSWLRKYCKIWDKFTEADGKTIEAAYGYRWRNKFGRDQLMDAIETLIDNPSDRRIYISAWDPGADGLGRPGKNVPCPVGFTLSIFEDELHSTLLIRSSDVFVGLPYDLMGHAMLLDIIKATLPMSIRLGTLTVSLAHPHLYDSHFEQAKQYLKTSPLYEGVPMLGNWGIVDVENNPDLFVKAYKDRGDHMEWPEYSPRPDVIA